MNAIPHLQTHNAAAAGIAACVQLAELMEMHQAFCPNPLLDKRTQPAMPRYLLEHFQRAPHPYDPTHAPDGYIPLCVAENRLVWDLQQPKLQGPRSVPAEALAYADMTGTPAFREALARFLARWVLGRSVAPEHLAVLAGAGSVLEILFYALGDPGDGVLVPTPSYAGFWMDLELRDGLHLVPVPTHREEDFRLTPEALDRALQAAPMPIRALLYTSPNNPVGTVASAAELEAVLAWAEARSIHVVMDEVYALSVFGHQPFVSAAHLRPNLGDFVHIIWAFSKDMAASGLRCGVLVSENEAVLQAVNGLAYWSACSGDTLHLLGDWITDEPWLEAYIPEMRRRLGASAAMVVDRLREAGIPTAGGEAGFFVLVDLSKHLETPTFEAEEQLWWRLLEAGINLTPGHAIRSPRPGLFRLCFASVDPSILSVALDRLVAVVRGPAR